MKSTGAWSSNELLWPDSDEKAHIDGLVQQRRYSIADGSEQERRNSIANALELHLSCPNPST